MRSDKEKITNSEREIDDFLSQFETPVDEISTDINSYLDDIDSAKATAAHTFYNLKLSDFGKNKEKLSSKESSSSSSVNNLHTGNPNSSDKKGSKKSNYSKKITKDNWKEKLFLKDNPNYRPNESDFYIQDGKKIKNKPKVVSPRKIVRDFIYLMLLFVACGFIYALGCITMAPRVNPEDIYASIETSSMILDDQGKQVDSVFYTQNRKLLKYEDLPENLVNSFIALEDKTFWKHHGFNWTRMIGAVLSSFTGGGRISGTSTITQQLARNVYLADTKSDRNIKRKILEMYYASRIEAAMSKKEIVTAYLNTIYLGYGCYGVDAASKAYFSKDVKDLSLVQCASLAALPQAPDYYALLKYTDDATNIDKDSKVISREPDTIVTNDIAKDRRDLAIKLMLDQNLIDKEAYDKAYDKKLTSFIDPTITKGNGNYSYFHEYLVETVIDDLVKKYGISKEDAERKVYTQGLKIYSTMDSEAQNVVAKEFQKDSNFPGISGIYYKDGDGNILNNDGQIAMYNYENDFNDNGDFVLSGKDVNVNKDGSITIVKNRKLNIYETDTAEGTDYSLEFKVYYIIKGGKLYAINGGYINIPSNYKSLDKNGNLVISKEYFADNPNKISIDGDKVIIHEKSYSLDNKTIQPQGAMVIVKVGTGEVKAMVGGRSFRGQKLFNRATNARQPGSSIKPLTVYSAALQKSYELQKKGQKWTYTDFGVDKQGVKGYGDYITMNSSVQDERMTMNGKTWPNNYTHSFSGKNTFVTAIQKSINTCAVKILLQVTPEYSIKQLKKFGITTSVDDTSKKANDVNPAALALGAMAHGTQPLEMAEAYAAFPGKGTVHTPVCYKKVVDRNGKVLLESKSKKTQVLDPGVAWIMTNVLQSVVRANGYLHVEGTQVGGKTGTTNDTYDVWFSGFTPNYAATLWLGTDQNIELASSSNYCASLWGRIMNQIANAKKGNYVKQPDNVIQVGGNYYTKGTEKGLSSYKAANEEKKERDRAYQRWLEERENHKRWVVDTPARTETRKRVVEVPERIDPDTGQVIPSHTEVETYEVNIPEVGHWEYEPGWRDGDFKYKSGA